MGACGVLALQGDWHAHMAVLGDLGTPAHPVRTAAELAAVEALVCPGGESTAMIRLMEAEDLARSITARATAGMPILGTCAGLILLAHGVDPVQPTLGVLDVDVRRNAYGRQVASSVVDVDVAPELGPPHQMPGVFIRAPRIVRVGPSVSVLARRGDDAALVRQGNILAATFHPELTDDRRVHRLFLSLAEETDG